MRFLLTIMLLLAATDASAQPPPVTAEEVIAEGRRLILGLVTFDLRRCGKQPGTDEIVVCAPDEDTASQRLGEFPEEVEAPTFTGRRDSASAFDASRCIDRCPPQAQIDVKNVARTLRRGLGRLLDRD